jgi:hypothetical protein
MTRQITFTENWNGILLTDCFPIIRPQEERFSVGQEFSIMVRSEFAGYASIVSGKTVHWGNITDNLSFAVMGKNNAYLKKVLCKMFGFGAGFPTNDYQVFFGYAQWTQRHLPVQATLFQKWYTKAAEKHTIHTADEFNQETSFNINQNQD